MAAEYDCMRVFANALTSLAARWQVVGILTAFGHSVPEFVPQDAIATRGAERCRDEHRMVDGEATANWERLDFCTYSQLLRRG